MRAARLLKKASGTPLGASIHVTKRIPAGGGLGGGSSDAATVLLALNQLWEPQLAPGTAGRAGSRAWLGCAGVRHGHSAWAAGRGEQLVPLDLAAALVPHRSSRRFHQHGRGVRCGRIDPRYAGHQNRGRAGRRRSQRLRAGGSPTLSGSGSRTGLAGCAGSGLEADRNRRPVCLRRSRMSTQATRLLAQLPRQWNGYVARSL